MKSSIAQVLLVLSAVSPSIQIGGYPFSCGEVRLDDATMNPQYLTGDCDSGLIGGGEGIPYKTRLDLNLCYSPNDQGIMVPTDAGIGLDTPKNPHPCVECFIGNNYEIPQTYYACDCWGDAIQGYAHSGVHLGKPKTIVFF